MRHGVFVLLLVATSARATAPLLEVSLGAAELSLKDRSFDGSGHPLLGDGSAASGSVNVHVDGRALGVNKLVAAELDTRILFLTRYHLAFGGYFGALFGDSGQGATFVDGQTVGSSLSGFFVGPEVDTVLAHGPLELRAGFALGYRSVSFPITSFAKISCGRGGRCYPKATDHELFVEPRVTVGAHLGRVFLGAYAGGDVMPGGGWSAGGIITLSLPSWRAHAQIRPR